MAKKKPFITAAKLKKAFKSFVIPTLVIVVFVGGLGIFIDDYVASQGDYRVTLLDILNGRGELPEGRAEVSQQVAIEICRQRALSELGRDLLQTRFDQRSSRYASDKKVHTVFINLVIKGKEREPMYIRCDISAVNRMILESRIKGQSGFSLFG